MSDANYRDGVPSIPPHRHTGVDNLKIDAADILNLPPGSAPGGTNSDVQFNDNGTFGGDPQFTFTPSTGVVHLHDIDNRLDPPNDSFELGLSSINGQRLLLTTNNVDTDGNVLGDTGDILIASDGTIPNSKTGSVDILTGTADDGGNVSSGTSGHITLQTGPSNKHTGPISIITGDVSGNPSPNSAKSGDITIQSGFAYGNAGTILLQAGNSISGANGSIQALTIGPDGGSGGDILSTASGVNIIQSGVAGVQIKTKSNAGSGNPSGNISIITGDADSGLPSGDINITTGSSGTSQGNVVMAAAGLSVTVPFIVTLSGKVVNLGQTVVDTTGMFDFDGTVTIADRSSGTPISGSPAGGGMLYSEGGALFWLGSSGTTTMIAPA